MAAALNSTNRVLLALVLALSALLWGPAAFQQSPLSEWLTFNQTSVTETYSLTQLQPADITEIVLVAANRAPINLSKTEQQWWLLTPDRQLANQSKVAALLKLLESPTYTRFQLPTSAESDESAESDAFIVKNTAVSVTFNDLTIGFGQRHPVGLRRYLILGDETALVDDYYFHHVAGPWQNWVAATTD